MRQRNVQIKEKENLNCKSLIILVNVKIKFYLNFHTTENSIIKFFLFNFDREKKKVGILNIYSRLKTINFQY